MSIHVIHIPIIRHIDKYGNILWDTNNLHNILHDEGERAILSAYFATGYSGYGAPPANLYLGLDNRSSLAESDTLSSLSGEPSGNGYARQALSTSGTGVSGQDFVILQPGTYYRAESKTVTFSCSTTAWSAVSKLFLCTASSGTSGKLISSVALTTSRTLNPGDSLQANLYIGLSE
jgi:hypothetical protein